MCGIAGIIGAGASEENLSKMLARIKHRGEEKYQNENLISNNISIGMNRLAIVDEYNGKQPFSTDDGTYIIFNGEIYNYKELKFELSKYYTFNTNCDTEVILYCYKHWGKDFVSKLDGMYAFCIINKITNEYLLVRDHIGIKPLYYTFHDDSIYFASELKAFSDLEFLQKIYLLEPGCLVNTNEVLRYYALPHYSNISINPQILLKNLKDKLTAAVKKMLPSDNQKVAFLLSGGLDSSIILYIASTITKNIEAFTLANSLTSSADLHAATQLCKELNIKHIIVTPQPEELQKTYLEQGVYITESYEPVLVRNVVSYYTICKTIQAYNHKYLINGEGADELFGGYDYFKELPTVEQDNAIRLSLTYLHRSYLQMADRASMYTTIEARVPYMDKDLIDYSFSLPSYFRINMQQDKWGLREAFSDELPEYIIKRKKVGMTEGAGFGRNRKGVGIYYDGVERFYNQYPEKLGMDLIKISMSADKYNIDRDNLEEVYNLARFIELGFGKYTLATERLQLNTPLLKNVKAESII